MHEINQGLLKLNAGSNVDPNVMYNPVNPIHKQRTRILYKIIIIFFSSQQLQLLNLHNHFTTSYPITLLSSIASPPDSTPCNSGSSSVGTRSASL